MKLTIPSSVLVKGGLDFHQAMRAKKEFEARFPTLKFFLTEDRGANALKFLINETANASIGERSCTV